MSLPLLSEDLLHLIIELFANDVNTLRNLSLVSRVMVQPCQSAMFSNFSMGTRYNDRMATLLNFMVSTPSVASLIKYFTIHDADMEGIVEGEMPQLIEDSPFVGAPYVALVEHNSVLPQILGCFTSLRALTVLLINQAVPWSAIAPSVVRSLFSVLTRPQISHLHLEGVVGLPNEMVRNFRNLESLTLARCTITSVVGQISKNLEFKHLPASGQTNVYGARVLGKLEVYGLSPSSLETLFALSPLNFSRLQCLRVAVAFWDEMTTLGRLINVCKDSLEEFSIDTTHLGLSGRYRRAPEEFTSTPDLGLQPPPSASSQTERPYNWFAHFGASVGSLALLKNLRKLTLSVSSWTLSSDAGRNGEIAWVLELLKSIPQNQTIEELTLLFKVGSKTSSNPVLSLAAFLQDSLWLGWDEVFTSKEWSKLRSVDFILVSDIETWGQSFDEKLVIVEAIAVKSLPSLKRRGILWPKYWGD